MQALDLPRRYASIFCGGGSFGLLTEDADISLALSTLRGLLRPGGIVSFEVETPLARPSLRPGGWSGRWWHCPDDEVIVLRHVQGAVDANREQGLGIYELYRSGTLVHTERNEWV